MSQAHNGQLQIQCAQSKPKGKYTGERIPGAKYRMIVDLAAQGRQIDRIAHEAKVTWRTAKAVVERESRQIAQRKQELLEQSLRIARRAANRIEDNIDKLPVGQLIPAYGVAVDKVAALSPDCLTIHHLHDHTRPSLQELIDTLHALNAAAEKRAKAAVVEVPALPAGQAPSANHENAERKTK